MKKIGIFVSLLLIIWGIIGFVYLIKIEGGGPGISWCAMGPFILGIMMLFILTYKTYKQPNTLLPRRRV